MISVLFIVTVWIPGDSTMHLVYTYKKEIACKILHEIQHDRIYVYPYDYPLWAKNVYAVGIITLSVDEPHPFAYEVSCQQKNRFENIAKEAADETDKKMCNELSVKNDDLSKMLMKFVCKEKK